MDSVLIVSNEEYDGYKKDINVILKDGRTKISIKLLVNLISNSDYYIYIEKLFNDEFNLLKIGFIKDNSIISDISINKINFLEGLKLFIEKESYIDNNILNKLSELLEKVSFENLRKKYQNDFYNILIDGYDYTISINEMLYFLSLNEEKYEEKLKNNIINGVIREHYIYAIREFCKEYNLMNNYIIDNKILKRIREFEFCEKVDIEAINKYLKNNKEVLDKFKVNEQLREVIFNGLPLEFNDLEKAIYVYIKLCKILTYDEEFFALNQKGDITEIHSDIAHIENITPVNNSVVCYEFNVIYAKMLNELGINCEMSMSDLDKYGQYHTSLKFRCDKFIVNADAVTSIIHGDIARAKLNQPLSGLYCHNQNYQTQKRFNEIFIRVYNFIAKEFSKTKNKVLEFETLEEIMEEYSLGKSIQNSDLDARLSILIDKVNKENLKGIDALSYALQLRRILFTEDECDYNISIVIIGNNESSYRAKASAIIVLNDEDIYNDSDDNVYYFYNPNDSFVPIDRITLQQKFINGEYCYIERTNLRIPNLILNRRIMKK